LLRTLDKWDDPLEGKSVCAFKPISQFLDKREHSRTEPTQRQRAPATMICVPRNLYSAYDAKMDPNDSILSIAERLAKYCGGGTDCSLPLVAANQKHAKRKFAGIVLVSDNESWVGTGRHGSTGVMTAWEAFVANQRKLAGKEASPKLVNIDLQPYQTVQACERADIMNIGGFSDSVFNVISAFLADNDQRFVAEVEAIEL
jgi:60 kDa SS-A/Ro ribonucleoprotein